MNAWQSARFVLTAADLAGALSVRSKGGLFISSFRNRARSFIKLHTKGKGRASGPGLRFQELVAGACNAPNLLTVAFRIELIRAA